MWATVAYLCFRNSPDVQDYCPVITPSLPVVDGSVLYQQAAFPVDADTVGLAQKMYSQAILSRPQNFCFNLLQHLFVQTQIVHRFLQPLIFILQLPQTRQFCHTQTGKFLPTVNGMDYLLPLRLTVRNVLTRRITMNIVFLGIDLAKNVFQLSD
ncbi:hypothetical protein DET57_11925 [Klebsiella oxytoca]|uniref:Uncharacterized protein n=1 Tax=Klebsiella oxytoca TaxID=571 RepID=A0A318FG73_KLEOX|nr:hypothetical protein DET57_11925 [Klebsiella oxytoca]